MTNLHAPARVHADRSDFSPRFSLGYWVFFNRYFEWPGNILAAGLGAVFAAMGLSLYRAHLLGSGATAPRLRAPRGARLPPATAS